MTSNHPGSRNLLFLADAGIVRRMGRGRRVYCQANPDCPVFAELKGLVVKTSGVAGVLLAPLADSIRAASGIKGSHQRGESGKITTRV